jgi:hypothetical protein
LTTLPESSPTLPEKRRWSVRSLVPEMWASLAIAVIWLAVLFDAVFGPDIWTSSSSGNSSKIPSVIVVVLFAYLATRVVARYGFGHRDKDTG